jgi:hypothetical protein
MTLQDAYDLWSGDDGLKDILQRNTKCPLMPKGTATIAAIDLGRARGETAGRRPESAQRRRESTSLGFSSSG